MTRLAFACIGALLATPAFAAGLALPDGSARGLGMANAMTASVDDASALFYNPAGMTRAGRWEIQIGDTAVISQYSFTGAQSGLTTQNSGGLQLPAHGYALWNGGDASFGLAFFQPFGNSVTWPEAFEGRFITQSQQLATYEINPQASFRIAKIVRAGVGVEIVRATLFQQRALNFLDREGGVELGANAWGFGANLGVQVDAIPDKLVIGATFRSAVGLHLGGRSHFSNVPPELADSYHDQTVATDMILPDQITLGIAYFVTPELRIAVDGSYVSWQRIGTVTSNFLADPTLDTFDPKHWTHAFNVRAGVEWRHGALSVRGGVEYDQTPIPDATLGPDVVDADRVGVACGLGYRVGGFSGDVGYRLSVLTAHPSTDVVLPGSYSGLAHQVGITLGYRLE